MIAMKAVAINPNENDVDMILEQMERAPQKYSNDMFLFAQQVARECKD
jgi:hypothetical protein